MNVAGTTSARMRCELILPCVPGSCRKARLLAAEVCKDAGLTPTGEYRVLLAVDELCQNVVQHAYGGPNPNESFRVILTGGPGRVEVTVSDNGCGFDSDDALCREETMHEDLESLMHLEHRGLSLVASLMDSRAIESVIGGGTTVRVHLGRDAADGQAVT